MMGKYWCVCHVIFWLTDELLTYLVVLTGRMELMSSGARPLRSPRQRPALLFKAPSSGLSGFAWPPKEGQQRCTPSRSIPSTTVLRMRGIGGARQNFKEP